MAAGYACAALTRVRFACVTLTMLAACDPGWSYVVPGGKEINDNGLYYELAGPNDTTLRAHANLFTSNLWTEVWITNTGPTPLEIRPKDVRMLTRFGRPLPLQRPVQCREKEGDAVALGTDETCQLSADFSEQPDQVELKFVTWMLPARRSGNLFPLTIKFVTWMLPARRSGNLFPLTIKFAKQAR